MAKDTFRTAIRKFCLDCVANSSQEVTLCTDPECALYKYRFGRSPKAKDPKYIKGSTTRYIVNGVEMDWINGKGWTKI